jgi:hypothetical protein
MRTTRFFSVLLSCSFILTYSCKNKDLPLLAAPVIEKIFPNYIVNESEITVTGKNLGNFSEQSVTINGFKVNSILISPTKLKLTLPSGLLNKDVLIGKVRLLVGNQSTEGTIFSNFYPKIDSFEPRKTSVGNEIIIHGKNFNPGTDGTIVMFTDMNGKGVRGNVTFVDAEIIKVTIPPNLGNNYIMVIVKVGKGYEPAILYSKNKLIIQ